MMIEREIIFIRDLGMVGILSSIIKLNILLLVFSLWIFLVPESIIKLKDYLVKKNVERNEKS